MSSASRPEFCAAWYDVSSRWCQWSLVCNACRLMGGHFGLPTETPGGSASKRMRRLNGVFTRARSHVSGRARKMLKAPRAAVIRSPCRAEEASGWALFSETPEALHLRRISASGPGRAFLAGTMNRERSIWRKVRTRP